MASRCCFYALSHPVVTDNILAPFQYILLIVQLIRAGVVDHKGGSLSGYAYRI